MRPDSKSGRVVNFTVHKNTLEKRRRRAMRDHALSSVKKLPHNIDGWVLISYWSDGEGGYEHAVDYYTEDVMERARVMPYIISCLKRYFG